MEEKPITASGETCFQPQVSPDGEWLAYLFRYLGIDSERSYVLVTVSFIAIASLATSLGFFDRLARHGGAGTLLPVTGFSNAVTSSAIDTASEGYISGVGSKIFTVAGPVILYSTVAGTVWGLIYYIYKMAAPAFGPISTIKSAERIVSSSCSTTIKVLPKSRKRLSVPISFSLSL